jgi:mRNA interferase MazF
MKDGDILLATLRQSDGAAKDRPVVLLRHVPPFDDLLVCGISSQLQQSAELDESITPNDADFRTSGLKAASIIRLGFLAVVPRSDFRGRIGSISRTRHRRLLERLAEFIRPK